MDPQLSSNGVDATAQASAERSAQNSQTEHTHTQKKCYFFELLPLELRREIYRRLFKRPLRICPSNVRYSLRDKDGYRVGMPRLEYRYYWDGYAQSDGGYAGPHRGDPPLPRFNHCPRSYKSFWLTMPTPSQSMIIESANVHNDSDEDINLPSFYDADRGVLVQPKVFRRTGSNLIQIINHADVIATAIHGVAFLQTCRAVATEGSEVLYGDNKYSFDSTISLVNSHGRGANDYDVFESTTPGSIPGLINKDGTSMTETQLEAAIHSMFEPDPQLSKQPKFIRNDPFTRFCNTIGLVNASLIRDIKLDGQCKTKTIPFCGTPAIGFDRLLPIYATILHRAFHSLRKVTIHVPIANRHWQGGDHSDSLMSDEDRIDAIMQRFVKAIPNMQQLQIGHGSTEELVDEAELMVFSFQSGWSRLPAADGDIWGKSVRLMKVVEDRHDARVRLELLKKEEQRT